MLLVIFFLRNFVPCFLGCFFDSELKSFANSANRCKQSQTNARKKQIALGMVLLPSFFVFWVVSLFQGLICLQVDTFFDII
jgi:hypothetical protein